jgi:hypothetical protein
LPTQTKQVAQTKQTQAPEKLSFSVVSTNDIPKVVRAGRTSRYAPLYERAKTLGEKEVIALPIKKYSQVQAFRGRLDEMGLNVNVRKTEKGLVAYISHAQPEPEEKS